MNWKTIFITATLLILWLLLVVFIKTNNQDTPKVEISTAESEKQPGQNIKSLAEIKEEIQFIVQDSIEEEIQKEVTKKIEQSAKTNGSSK